MKTDHQALVWLFGQAGTTKHSVLQRWILRLNGFDFECIYTPGKVNRVCDALSRYPNWLRSMILRMRSVEMRMTTMQSFYDTSGHCGYTKT
jgi:hypothetical protein